MRATWHGDLPKNIGNNGRIVDHAADFCQRCQIGEKRRTRVAKMETRAAEYSPHTQRREPTPPVPSTDIALAEHAAVIRALGKRVVGDIIEIGRRLTEAKKLAGHGGWLPWLDREFGWTDDTALNFMRCNDLAKNRNFRDLSLPVSGLYLLAAPNTTEEAREAVIERAKNGEALSVKDVQRMIDEARRDSADALREQIAALNAEAAQREKDIRAEYAGKVVIDPFPSMTSPCSARAVASSRTSSGIAGAESNSSACVVIFKSADSANLPKRSAMRTNTRAVRSDHPNSLAIQGSHSPCGSRSRTSMSRCPI